MLKQYLTGYLIGVALVAVIFLLTSTAHCAVTTRHENSLGIPMYTSNPLMYQMGNITEASDVEGSLNLRFKPFGTYVLYDENLLICGMPLSLFRDKEGVVVLTYGRVAHRTVEGVGCHNLKSVNRVYDENVQ